VGSNSNCSNSMTTLNAIVAKAAKRFQKEVDALIETKT
jgi:glutamine synthetase